jgi:hypothetical protein
MIRRETRFGWGMEQRQTGDRLLGKRCVVHDWEIVQSMRLLSSKILQQIINYHQVGYPALAPRSDVKDVGQSRLRRHGPALTNQINLHWLNHGATGQTARPDAGGAGAFFLLLPYQDQELELSVASAELSHLRWFMHVCDRSWFS